ncbi:MAG: DUF2145 domain-containing protein [Arenimonas sp.]
MKQLLILFIVMLSQPVFAGTQCSEKAASPRAITTAAESAQRVLQQLEKNDAPVAMLARHGTNLEKYGLHYSHIGFVVRDHADGRWTVVHLLNQCGSQRSDIYAQGLVNFFLDDLQSQDTRIVWLKPELAARMSVILNTKAKSVFDSNYNVIARYDSKHYQNSTAWVLDMLSVAQLPASQLLKRSNAQALEKAQGFTPDVIHIDYTQRILGGLFSANTVFTDHSVGARLSGEYKIVTVRSIFRYLEQLDAINRQWEWRSGRETKTPWPA